MVHKALRRRVAVIGPRLGRKRMNQQYAFLYDPDVVEILGSYTYEDSQDLFHREPFSTSCAYDRIIVTQEVLESIPKGQPRYQVLNDPVIYDV